LFVIGYLLIASVFLAVGLCLLTSPRTYFRLLDRMAQVNLWARSSASWDPNSPRWRAVGAAFIFFALFMVLGPLLSFYIRSPEEFRGRLDASYPSANGSTDVSWAGVVVLLLFLALGLGFLTRPLAILDRVSPHKLSADAGAQRHAYILRIFGALLLSVSLLGMWVQLSRYFRR
jgi:hypothetical protein